MGLPFVVKPGALPECATTKRARRVCVQFQIMSISDIHFQERSCPIPCGKKGVPPHDVCMCFSVDFYAVMEALSLGTK